MGNGLSYSVPPFQRNYSWGANEWEELWEDILDSTAASRPHYMGYLVLQSENDREFSVIDGQQRLATLAILVLAGLRNLDMLVEKGSNVEQNKKRMEQLRNSYIGYLDPVSLATRSKLSLNRNNDRYFQEYMVPLQHLPRRGLAKSTHSLRKAFEWLCSRIGSHVGQDGDDPGEGVARLIEGMSDMLVFTVIMVTDDLDAYRVFETLNARGVRLSSTDLLKNHLFSLLERAGSPDDEIERMDDKWVQITQRLGEERFPDFLRCHWMSRIEQTRRADLFRRIRGRIKSREDVFDLLGRIDEDVDPYLDIVRPESDAGLPCEQLHHLRLLQVFGVRQPFPLLLAARRRLDDSGFLQVLKAVSVVSFRYNVIGSQPPSRQEDVYGRQALRIERGEFGNAGEIVDALAEIYPKDDSFREMFADRELPTARSRSRRLVGYILCELERESSGKPLDYASGSISLEHVCPLSPEQGWEDFGDDGAGRLASRIGNMTLLKASQNREIGNAPYEKKLPIYRQSAYRITRDLAEQYEQWKPDCIDSRQRDMASAAVRIWRIERLS